MVSRAWIANWIRLFIHINHKLKQAIFCFSHMKSLLASCMMKIVLQLSARMQILELPSNLLLIQVLQLLGALQQHARNPA